MNGPKPSREPTSPKPEIPPADGDKRSQFAARELGARAAAEEDARQPDQVLGAEGVDQRSEFDDAQDAIAIVRAGFLFTLYARVRRGRSDKADVANRRSRVDSRAQRVGGRLGPRVGRLLGGAMFWAGCIGEVATEVLEELIDGELEAQAKAAAEPKPEAQP